MTESLAGLLLRAPGSLPEGEDVDRDVVRRIAAEALSEVAREAATRCREDAAVRLNKLVVATGGLDALDVAPGGRVPCVASKARKPRVVQGRAGSEQRPEAGAEAEEEGILEWRSTSPVASIDVCAGVEKDLKSGRLSITSCTVQSRFSISGPEHHVGTSFDESTHDICVPTACRTSEGRAETWRGDAVWVCARGKQDTHHTDVGRAHRKFEGSRFVVTLGVPIQRVYLTPHREGRFDHRRRRR